MTYDKIDWHVEALPKGLNYESAGTHIGMFIWWAIRNNLLSEFHLRNSQDSINKVLANKMTGRDFLIEECDTKFWDQDLNNQGNKFAQFYYANEKDYGDYINDYSEVFNNYITLFDVEDTYENYLKIEKIINRKYNDWNKA